MQNVSSIFLNDLAATIGKLEKRNKAAQFILETAAILHDIGIHVSEQKYGSKNCFLCS